MMAAIGILTGSLGVSPFAAAVMIGLVFIWGFSILWWICSGFWKVIAFGIKTIIVFAFIAFTLVVMGITGSMVLTFVKAMF